MTFAGKVVLITGSSSGIGKETAIHFSHLGASVVITGRNAENLQKVADQMTGPKLAITGDVTNEKDIKNLVDSTIKQFGKLDVLVNNAGAGISGSIETTTLEDLDQSYRINLRSVYYLTMLAVPHLIKTRGNIVNISSIGGLRSVPGSLPYCTMKSALDQFTGCVAMELADKQVRVNSVNPGTVTTEFFSRMGLDEQLVAKHFERSKGTHPLGRTARPSDIAAAISFLASDAASFITGILLPVDGGRHAVCPR